MVEQFLNHIQRHKLCKTSDKILLAVSGGLDSMVMLHLFQKAGFQVGVAHCNFQLRAADSDADELLVEQYCRQRQIAYHAVRFETAAIAEQKRESIQLVARSLRYEYFEKLLHEFRYDSVATAHHLNDSLETLILNLVRGTGIDGLTGIPVRVGNVIRPLLFTTRETLETFAKENQILWREDKSNTTDDYQRNFVRHQIVPQLRALNPNLESTFANTIERLRATSFLSKAALNEIQREVFTQQGPRLLIDKIKLQRYPFPHAVLWELLKRKGFNFQQCQLLLADHQSGKVIGTKGAVITVDREYLIMERISDAKEPIPVMVDRAQQFATLANQKLSIKEVPVEQFSLLKQKGIAQLDADQITFPMTWRPWRQGDSFIPLGMNTHKKISDLLIDEKISMPDKRTVTVLESDGRIIWVVGLRISETHKVTASTKKVLIIETLPA